MIANNFSPAVLVISLGLISCSGDDVMSPAVDNQTSADVQFEDVIWSLVEFTSSTGAQTMLIDDTAYQFKAVSSSGDIRGLANCNASSGGSYQLNDGSVVLNFGPFEEAVCEGDEVQSRIEQNSTIDELLYNSQNNPRIFAFDERSLVLSLADGRNMVFNQVDQFSTL